MCVFVVIMNMEDRCQSAGSSEGESKEEDRWTFIYLFVDRCEQDQN